MYYEKLHDQVAENLDRFLDIHGEAIVSRCLRSILNKDLRTSPGAAARAALIKVCDAASALAERNDKLRLLMIFRRVPLNYFFEKQGLLGEILHSIFCEPAVIGEAVAFGTNCILAKSPRRFRVQNARSLLRTVADHAEHESALELFVLSALHRTFSFMLNTEARKGATDHLDLHELIDSYNNRTEARRPAPFRSGAAGDSGIVIPILAHPIPAELRTFRISPLSLPAYEINHRNYFPILQNFGELEPYYRHLEGGTFEVEYQMSYRKWLLIFKALNSLLFQSIATLWSDFVFKHVSERTYRASVERADDFGQSALGIASVESLIRGCMALVLEKDISRTDVQLFINRHTDSDHHSMDPLIEREQVFYTINDTSVFWDYFRMASLLPVIPTGGNVGWNA